MLAFKDAAREQFCSTSPSHGGPLCCGVMKLLCHNGVRLSQGLVRVADTKHQREVEVSTYVRTNVVSAPSPMY